MYIKSYKCTRFAGLKNKNIEFDRGINVILGPNESGKSTLIEGIHSTLFKDTKLRRSINADKDFVFKFMPKPSGDFIDGKLVIKRKEGEYKISKEWGSSENIELLTPEGSIIKNKDDINEELSKILSFGESTYSSIVFAKQRELKQALYNIIGNSQVTKEISDVLRMTLMELDGISIDSIQNNIEIELDNLYKRWNRERNYPENNRGINNPYKVGLGKILESYYNKENLKVLMARADKTEKEFEIICNAIKDLSDKKEMLNKEKIELENIEEDVNNRSILNAEIRAINRELEDLMKANREWPMAEQLLEQLDEKLLDFREQREKLNQEKKNLEKVNKKESLENKLKRINEIQENINNIIQEIINIPSINDKDISSLSKLQTDILTLETTMKAGKMIGILKKSNEKQIYVRRDFGDPEVLKTDTTFEARGLINISYDEFELEIKTGDMDFEELSNQYKLLKKQLNHLLNDLNIDSIEAGKLNLQSIRSKESAKSSLEKELEFILANNTREELEEELKELGDIKVFRNLIEIENGLKDINEAEISISAEKRSKISEINLWKEKYTNHDNLFELVIDERANLKDRENKLKELKPLPDKFETVETFKNRLGWLRKELNDIQLKQEELNDNYYVAKNNLLDDTYEEFKKEYIEAEKTFERNINRGEKLIEIQRVFMETKERLSGNPMESLVNEFARLLEIITDGDYKTGDIDEGFNIRLKNPNGEIPIELLSAGTYDCVSLALRFSLIKHIFQDMGGYVILDDCLVDLDPVRKKQAIRLINDFSKDYQVIFTTCDPETAQMLGGNIIEL